MKRENKTFIFWLTTIFFAVIFGAADVSAATITVTNTNSSGAGSLSAAIAGAADGDTINFNLTGCPCAIVGGYNVSNKNIIINGPGAAQLTLSGNNAGRIFTVNRSSMTISDLTVANGVAALGGGISFTGNAVAGESLTIINSVINNNRAAGNTPNGVGGGIYVFGGSVNLINSVVSNNSADVVGGGVSTPFQNVADEFLLTFSNSTISGNTAIVGGGGVYASQTASITGYNTSFNDNSARRGGGIFNRGTGTIRGGTFSGNDATNGEGGGIFSEGTLSLTNVAVLTNTALSASFGKGGGIFSSGELKISNSRIANNQSASGGGILSEAALTINGSTIANNTATGSSQVMLSGGGGISINSSTTAVVTDSTVSGNSAGVVGGGIENNGSLTLTNSTVSGNQVTGNPAISGGVSSESGSSATITNCTIAFNSSQNMGGGLALTNFSGGGNAVVNVTNTIIAQNTSISNSLSPDVVGVFVSQGFNLIGNLRGNSGTGFPSTLRDDLVGGTSAQNPPIDARLAVLANNGGATQTHALLADSPAIDRGNYTPGIITDQRGNARFIDIPTVATPPGGSGSDIGAFEFAAPTAATVLVAGRVMVTRGDGAVKSRIVIVSGGEVSRSPLGGLAGATVRITKPNGSEQTLTTNPLGYFRFDDIEVGETYIFQVTSKRYSFAPQVVTVNEETTELNFVAQ